MENNFKNARELCKLSQKYVALELGVSAPIVSEWESGRKTPTVENLLKLKKLYKTSVDYLLGLTDEPGMIPVPEDLSLRGITDPEEKEQILSALSNRLQAHEALILKDAVITSKALSLSDKALQIAIAYEIADADSKDICNIALKKYLSMPIDEAKTG